MSDLPIHVGVDTVNVSDTSDPVVADPVNEYAIAAADLGTQGLAGAVLRVPPEVVVTGPTAVVTSGHVTVTWSYTSPIGRDQQWFQITLLTGAGSSVYIGPEEYGAATSHEVPFELQSFSTYQIELTVSDGIDESTAFWQFTTGPVNSPELIADNPLVGTIYEVGINGVGLMMTDRPGQQQNNYKSQAALIVPDRLAVGTTPYSESLERYSFIGFDDWSGGADQKYRDKPGSDPTRFHESLGVDPFTEPGEVTLLEQPVLTVESDYTNLLAVEADGIVYVVTDDDELSAVPEPGDTPTVFTIASDPIVDVASDGEYWYATDGSEVFRNDTAADPTSAWSTVALSEIGWIGDRLAGFGTDGSGVPTFTTLAPNGDEEVTGGRFGFADAQLHCVTGGDGYAWWGVNRGTSGQIHAWNIGSDDGAFVALSLPPGEKIVGLFHYLGNVMVAAQREAGGQRIYRCVPQDGRLTPQLVTTVEAESDTVHFSGNDRFVAWAWPAVAGDDTGGLGVLDLQSGGFARWQHAPGGDQVQGVVAWRDRFAFTIPEVGLFGRSTDGHLYPSGWLETSIADMASSTVKAVTDVSLATAPLPVGSTVEVDLTVDDYASTRPVALHDSAGSTSLVEAQFVQDRAFGLRLTLNRAADTVSGPTVLAARIGTHPFGGPVDQILTIPVGCHDHMEGLNKAALKENKAGAGIARAAWLRSLVGQFVRFQDVDWVLTRQSAVYQVVGYDHEGLGTWNRNLGRREDGGTVTVSLRRKL